ncbi:unnamed protein product [Urochloa humidicola]
MPRMRSSAAVKETIRGGAASSEAVPGAAELDILLGKLKVQGVLSTERIDRQIVNCINLRCQGVMLQKTARTWVLLVAVVAGCAFGSGWTPAPTRKHLVKEEMMQDAKEHLHQDQTKP